MAVGMQSSIDSAAPALSPEAQAAIAAARATKESAEAFNAQLAAAVMRKAQIEADNAAPDVLKSGMVLTSAGAFIGDKTGKVKTYYSLYNGMEFIMPDGLACKFLGNMFVTADRKIQRELDAIVDNGASYIFSKPQGNDAQKAKVAREAQQVQNALYATEAITSQERG